MMVLKLIWPALIVLGTLAVFNHGDGSGFESPGFVLVPIGVIGGLITVSRKSNTSKKPLPLLIGLWVLVFLCVAKIYFAEPSGMFGLVPWVLAMYGFTIVAWILLVFHLFRK